MLSGKQKKTFKLILTVQIPCGVFLTHRLFSRISIGKRFYQASLPLAMSNRPPVPHLRNCLDLAFSRCISLTCTTNQVE